jgi:hypothetical protein
MTGGLRFRPNRFDVAGNPRGIVTRSGDVGRRIGHIRIGGYRDARRMECRDVP